MTISAAKLALLRNLKDFGVEFLPRRLLGEERQNSAATAVPVPKTPMEQKASKADIPQAKVQQPKPEPFVPSISIPEGLAPAERLLAIRDQLGDCKRCSLCQGRTNLVFGVGNPEARCLIVGEGPGQDEDLQGFPFVGRAGRLLDKMLAAIHLDRTKVYIANVVKCRPPGNRDPEPAEIAACAPYLKAQIDAMQPVLIIAVGRFAAQTLLNTQTPITKLRGVLQQYHGIALLPTYHPAFLLRNPMMKKQAWKDLQLAASFLAEHAAPA